MLDILQATYPIIATTPEAYPLSRVQKAATDFQTRFPKFNDWRQANRSIQISDKTLWMPPREIATIRTAAILRYLPETNQITGTRYRVDHFANSINSAAFDDFELLTIVGTTLLIQDFTATNMPGRDIIVMNTGSHLFDHFSPHEIAARRVGRAFAAECLLPFGTALHLVEKHDIDMNAVTEADTAVISSAIRAHNPHYPGTIPSAINLITSIQGYTSYESYTTPRRDPAITPAI